MKCVKQDIQSHSDIDDLMNRFYARVMYDEVTGYIFTAFAKFGKIAPFFR